MKILRFDAGVGRSIEKFGSVNVVQSLVAHLTEDATISCMHLGSGGILGYHQATTPQLFLVVRGEGWVRGEATGRVVITAGEAAFWESGEWHESGTETGMTAIVIESERLEPTEYMVGR